MADLDNPNQLVDSLSLPVGDLIAEVGRGVAEAQQALDAQVIENFKNIYGGDGQALAHLRDLGYRPTWYHIPEAEAELQVSLSITGNYSGEGKSRMYAAPVDATYKNNFDYSLEGSSRIKFRVVPIPEPANLELKRVVPNIVGMNFESAKTVLDSLGIAYELSEDAKPSDIKVESIEPLVGTMIDEEQSVFIAVSHLS